MIGAQRASNVTSVAPASATSTTPGPRGDRRKFGSVGAPSVEQRQIGEDGDELDENPGGAAHGQPEPSGHDRQQQQPSGRMARHALVVEFSLSWHDTLSKLYRVTRESTAPRKRKMASGDGEVKLQCPRHI